jgi:hypothetical protein
MERQKGTPTPAAAAGLPPAFRIHWLDERDLPDWDRFVSAHPAGTVYQLSAWKRFVEECFSHVKGGILALRSGTSGEIVAGIPIYSVRSMVFGRRLVSSPFATLGAVLVSETGHRQALLPPVLQKVHESRACRLELRGLRPADSGISEWPLTPLKQHLHHYVILPSSPEKLKSGFSRTIRREIGKSAKSGVEVRADRSPETVRNFSALQQRARRDLGLPVYPRRFFDALVRHLPESSVSILVASRNGVSLGMLLQLEFRDWIIAEHIAVTGQGKKLGVSHALFWEGMLRGISSGRRYYSFGRTALADAGLLQFKRAWGPVEEPLLTLVYPAAAAESARTGPTPRFGRLARLIFRVMPAPVARCAGNVFYRHWA